jgi:hypothetical protein
MKKSIRIFGIFAAVAAVGLMMACGDGADGGGTRIREDDIRGRFHPNVGPGTWGAPAPGAALVGTWGIPAEITFNADGTGFLYNPTPFAWTATAATFTITGTNAAGPFSVTASWSIVAESLIISSPVAGAGAGSAAVFASLTRIADLGPMDPNDAAATITVTGIPATAYGGEDAALIMSNAAGQHEFSSIVTSAGTATFSLDAAAFAALPGNFYIWLNFGGAAGTDYETAAPVALIGGANVIPFSAFSPTAGAGGWTLTITGITGAYAGNDVNVAMWGDAGDLWPQYEGVIGADGTFTFASDNVEFWFAPDGYGEWEDVLPGDFTIRLYIDGGDDYEAEDVTLTMGANTVPFSAFAPLP